MVKRSYIYCYWSGGESRGVNNEDGNGDRDDEMVMKMKMKE